MGDFVGLKKPTDPITFDPNKPVQIIGFLRGVVIPLIIPNVP